MRDFVAAGAVVSVLLGGVLVMAGGAEKRKPSAQQSAMAVLRERLAATDERLSGDEVLPTFQRLADAMVAAGDSGLSQADILGEVLAAHVRQWKRPGGMEVFLANNRALGDRARAGDTLAISPASAAPDGRSRRSDGSPGAADGPAAEGRNLPLQAPAPPKVVPIFANGVLNSGQQAGEAAASLSKTLGLKQTMDDAYNRSATDAPSNVANGQAMAQQIKNNIADPATRDLVDSLSSDRFIWPGGALAPAFGVDLFKNSLSQLVLQYGGSEEAARANTAYPGLMKKAREALMNGDRVILIGHSEGGFPVWQAKKDLDKEIAELRKNRGEAPAPSPVGGLYIAPPFGAKDKTDLSTGGNRYVLLNGDVLNGIEGTGIATTAEPTPPQPPADSLDPRDAVTPHLLNTYTQDGSTSRQQIIDAFHDLSGYVCKSPAATGLKNRPTRQQTCPVSPPPTRTPESPPEQSPGEPTKSPTEQSPGTPTDTPTPPEQPSPPQDVPTDTPAEPSGPATEQPPPPSHPPSPPQAPQRPGVSAPLGSLRHHLERSMATTIPLP
ncbi:hypothetical protein [Streptomyces sp. NPDC046832]|uniref:hypothetical protein n=1 Tax=Streptomyces sp. NPDC046832 TaxID=3155020 RepID=UPI003402BAEF